MAPSSSPLSASSSVAREHKNLRFLRQALSAALRACSPGRLAASSACWGRRAAPARGVLTPPHLCTDRLAPKRSTAYLPGAVGLECIESTGGSQMERIDGRAHRRIPTWIDLPISFTAAGSCSLLCGAGGPRMGKIVSRLTCLWTAPHAWSRF